MPISFPEVVEVFRTIVKYIPVLEGEMYVEVHVRTVAGALAETRVHMLTQADLQARAVAASRTTWDERDVAHLLTATGAPLQGKTLGLDPSVRVALGFAENDFPGFSL